MSGDTFRDTKDNRILTTLAAVSPVMLWHIVSLETFFSQLYFHLGRGWKASFPLCSIRRTCPGSDACLPCGLGQVTSPFWASGASFVKLEVMTLAAVLLSTSY